MPALKLSLGRTVLVQEMCGHHRPSRDYVVVALVDSQCCQLTMTIYNYAHTIVTKVYSCNNDGNCMCFLSLNVNLFLCLCSRSPYCRLLRKTESLSDLGKTSSSHLKMNSQKYPGNTGSWLAQHCHPGAWWQREAQRLEDYSPQDLLWWFERKFPRRHLHY